MVDQDHGMTPEEIEAIRERYGEGPHLAADLVVLTAQWDDTPQLRVLLIERGNKPFRGSFALPGGFVDLDEDLETAARRELEEETGVADLGLAYIEQLGTFGHPLRDPRSRVVSVVHMAWVPFRSLPSPNAGDDAAAARFFRFREGSVEDERGHTLALGFDHDEVLARAWRRAQTLALHTSGPLALAPETFTRDELGALFECFAGPLDRDALFHRLQRLGWIRRDGERWRAASTRLQWERPAWLTDPHPR